MGAKLKNFLSKQFWKTVLSDVVYFSLSLLVLHDVFIIVAHTFSSTFLAQASPYILDKLLNALIATLTM